MATKNRISNQMSLFGPLYAYLVIVSPPKTIKSAIAQIKSEMQQIAGIGDRNLQSLPHITLAEKLTDDISFPEMVTSLLNAQPCMEIMVKGWGFFDHGHSITVYLKIITADPLLHMSRLLKSHNTTPHLTLAKKITLCAFTSLLPYLENLDFKAQWTATEVTVLRKLMSEKHLGFREKFTIPLKC